MEVLIVCQLPGCQIGHVGSQQGFPSQPFMSAWSFLLLQSLQKSDWYASSQGEPCMPYLSDRPSVQTAGTSGLRIGVREVQWV